MKTVSKGKARLIWLLLLACLIIGAGVWAVYYYLYPPAVLQRQAQKALDGFAASIATKDRQRIGENLATLLTDSATVDLEVSFSQGLQLEGLKPVAQHFDKTQFITFVDNILYTLEDYAFTGQISAFTLSEDKSVADVTFDVSAWADGQTYYMGTGVATRFSTFPTCGAKVQFIAKQVYLNSITCSLVLRSMPKAEDIGKFRDPEIYRKFLMR